MEEKEYVPYFSGDDNGEGHIFLWHDRLQFTVVSKPQARILTEVLLEKNYISPEEEQSLLAQIAQSSLPESHKDKDDVLRLVAEQVTCFANLPWPFEVTKGSAENEAGESSTLPPKTVH